MHMLPTAYLFIASGLLCALTGCSQTPQSTIDDPIPVVKDAQSSSQHPDIKGPWALTKLGEINAIPGVRMIVRDGGEVHGISGCNNYNTSYTWQESTLSFGPVTGTKLLCKSTMLMAQEHAFYKALGGVNAASMHEGKLTLKGPETTLAFKPAQVRVHTTN